MKLLTLRNKEQQIINKIINNGGELDNDTETDLEITKTEILESIDSYAHVLKHTIKNEEQYWTDRKNEATKALKRIQNNKEFLKQQLHSISIEEDLVGKEYTISPDTNTSREIDISLVEENIGEYTVQMAPESFLRHFKDKPDDYISVNRKVLLKDLPKGHKAIETILTPTIKITKTK